MGGLQRAGCIPVFGFFVLAASSCMVTDPPMDLARNESLYRTPQYQAPRSTPQAVYVERLRDQRKMPVTDQGASYKKLFPDGEWARSVPVMIEECLVEAIDKSRIYRQVSEGVEGKPGKNDILVEPTLVELFRMQETMGDGMHLSDRRVVAQAGLRLKVYGPEDASSGKRPVLMDELFEHRVASEPIVGRPGRGYVQVGRALYGVMNKALPKLYESNISSVAAPEPGPGK